MLLARNDDAPRALLDALAARNIEVLECRSAWRAMANLCLLAKLAPQRAISLLILRPRSVPHAAQVVASAKRYVGALTVWQYDAQANLALRRVVSDDVRSWEADERSSSRLRPGERDPQRERSAPVHPDAAIPTPVVVPCPAAAGNRPPPHSPHLTPPVRSVQASLRLAGDGPLPANPVSVPPSSPKSLGEDEADESSSLLTEEELAMLLGDDELDEPSRVSNQ